MLDHSVDTAESDQDARMSDKCSPSRKSNNDREYRMQCCRRLVLWRKMLSFDLPLHLPVFHRIVVPCDDSSHEEVATSVCPVEVSAPLQSDVTQLKSTRKCGRNEKTWKRNVIKWAQSTGNSYTNYRSVVVPAKCAATNVQLCCWKCRFHCDEKDDNDSMEDIFSAYHSLSSSHAQDVCLFGCLSSSAPRTVAAEAK